MHTYLQLVSVLMAITGIVLFAYADGFESANLIGVALSVAAAIGAACYKVCTLVCHTWDALSLHPKYLVMHRVFA